MDCAVLCEASRKLIWALRPLLRAPRPHPRPRLRPVEPKLTPLLYIQEPAIIERRGSRAINSITSSIIANRVDRSTRREPSAFERNTMGSHFDFRDAGANKSNARDILTQ